LHQLVATRQQARLIGGAVERGDAIQHGRAELHPRAVACTLQRVGGMQPWLQRVVEVLADHRRLEDRRVADQQHRRLAER
jgi:hypothetical protein